MAEPEAEDNDTKSNGHGGLPVNDSGPEKTTLGGPSEAQALSQLVMRKPRRSRRDAFQVDTAHVLDLGLSIIAKREARAFEQQSAWMESVRLTARNLQDSLVSDCTSAASDAANVSFAGLHEDLAILSERLHRVSTATDQK